jgi:Ca-activated chloride channel family protein
MRRGVWWMAALGLLGAAVSGCAGDDAGGGYDYTGGTTPYAPYAWDAGGAVEMDDPRFDDVGINAFTIVDYDPFSTFAADVDTASYDIFRMWVTRSGALPPEESVRLEEYVNAFRYAYPAPPLSAEVPFDVHLALAPHPLGRDRIVLRVGLQAAEPPELVKLPSNLVFLVDVSGSMQTEDKLPLVKRLLFAALNELGENDTVSIVTYASSVGVRLGPTPLTDRAAIEEAIEGLSAGGSTAGASGIDLAYAEAQRGFIEAGFNHVVLMTDGDFNVGPYTTEELVALIETKRSTGVTLTALGFGLDNLNDAMMERVSNAGNGVYSVITDAADADRYAAQDLLRSTMFVAKDLKIQVEMNPEHVLAYRLLGYENRALADDDFRDDAVDAGEIGAGHQVTALYELVLTDGAIPVVQGAPAVVGLGATAPAAGTLERAIAAHEWVRVRLRWKDLAASETDPAHETAFAVGAEALGPADADLEWAMAIAGTAELLRGSPYAESGDRELIDALVTRLASGSPQRTQFGALWQLAYPLLGP